jgi:hypothetical protein
VSIPQAMRRRPHSPERSISCSSANSRGVVATGGQVPGAAGEGGGGGGGLPAASLR